MLSEQTFHLLSIIPEDGLPEDQFPCDCSLADFKDLESRGLVIVATLIPPGTECPGGMCYVRLTSAGRDALETQRHFVDRPCDHHDDVISESVKLSEQQCQNHQYNELDDKSSGENVRHADLQWLIGTIIAIVGVLASIFPQEIRSLILSFFEHIWSMLH